MWLHFVCFFTYIFRLSWKRFLSGSFPCLDKGLDYLKTSGTFIYMIYDHRSCTLLRSCVTCGHCGLIYFMQWLPEMIMFHALVSVSPCYVYLFSLCREQKGGGRERERERGRSEDLDQVLVGSVREETCIESAGQSRYLAKLNALSMSCPRLINGIRWKNNITDETKTKRTREEFTEGYICADSPLGLLPSASRGRSSSPGCNWLGSIQRSSHSPGSTLPSWRWIPLSCLFKREITKWHLTQCELRHNVCLTPGVCPKVSYILWYACYLVRWSPTRPETAPRNWTWLWSGRATKD